MTLAAMINKNRKLQEWYGVSASLRRWHGDVAEWQWFQNVTCHDIYWDALQAEIDRIACLSPLPEGS